VPSGLGTTAATVTITTAASGLGTTSATVTIYEKVRSALRRMGFRDAQARRAVAVVAGRHNRSEMVSLEQTLREAIGVAAAA
jgi:Holliday junction resolvasome RuvABC DNA-binding subunit